jgi:prepilin-type N-terminal cleavage/methylation domain-containing protein
MGASAVRQTHAFTLTELMIAMAIVSLLAAGAAVLFPRYIERAKTAEADVALAEVRRLENEFFARTGTFSSDLKEIGYQSGSELKYHTVFVQVENGPRGWSYMVLLMPKDQSQSGGRYVSQGPDGTVSNSAGLAASGGGSACGAWNGWGSMQGGKIEGEESLSKSSSGSPPCGGSRKIVDHGRSSGPAVSGH